MTAAPDPLTDQRAAFSLPPGLHYLNCASRAPLPKVAEAAGRDALGRQTVPPVVSAEAYFALPERLRARLADLIGTVPDRIALAPSVSYGVAIALHNAELRSDQNVVTPGQEFPSDVYGWLERCRASGAQLRTVPRPTDPAELAVRWSERIVDAIDARTAVVTLSTVHWTDGVRFDVEAIGARAREVGALYVLDGTQSIGAEPFDFERVRPDLLVCAAYKWLLGPYQIGFAAVGDRLLGGEPFEYHWSNRRGSEDVAGVDYRLEYRDGARRFDVGEHANDLPVSMLDASVARILEWTPAAVERYCQTLTGTLSDFLAESPFTTAAPSERCAHILGVRFPDPADLPRALAEMAAREVRVSRRGDSLRVSPYLYNTTEDIEALAEGLRAISR